MSLLAQMSAAQQPDLSVIVVTHNRPELAIAALRSARAASEGLSVEWTVIDSGSTDGTPEAIEAAVPALAVRRERNVGFAAANNLGIAHARGRYVLLMNPDVEIDTGTLGHLLQELDQRPSIGVASVIQRAGDGRMQASLRRFPSPLRSLGEALGASVWGHASRWREEVPPGAAYQQEGPADWLVGAFLLVRAKALAQVGSLDERFFLYSEETDWCYRFRKAGWDVWHLPCMSVTHHTPGTTSPDLLAQRSHSKVLFAHKHHGSLGALAIGAALALGHGLRALIAGLGSRIGAKTAPRAAAEARALAVVLKLARPPFSAGQLAPGARTHRTAPAQSTPRSTAASGPGPGGQAVRGDRHHAQGSR